MFKGNQFHLVHLNNIPAMGSKLHQNLKESHSLPPDNWKIWFFFLVI